MEEDSKDVTIPVYREEVTAGTMPVVTGGVRVTKHVQTREEIVEQELRKSTAQVKRVQVNRQVDGPLKPRREGNTLIVPVVSEVLHVEKRWMLTEEIHIMENTELATEQNTITLDEEHAVVERLDEKGNAVSKVEDVNDTSSRPLAGRSATGTSIVDRGSCSPPGTSKRKILTGTPAVVRERRKRD
jgi:stress response protein YsnF